MSLEVKKILYPTDFSECSKRALDHALFLAEEFEAELHMLHVITLHEDDPYNPAYHFEKKEELYERVHKFYRENLVKLLEDKGPEEKIKIVQVERKNIHAAPEIISYAEENDIDLIVMGTRGRRGLSRLLLGSVAAETVKLSSCPVLTVRYQEEREFHPEKIDKILLPLDFSAHSKTALAYAKEFDQRYSAELHLLHVIEKRSIPQFYVSILGTISQETYQHLKELSLQIMNKLAENELPKEVKAVTAVEKGDPARKILKYIEDNSIDMVIISTHGLSDNLGIIWGSVSEKIVLNSQCPVLTVKSFGKNLIKEEEIDEIFSEG